MKYIFSIIFCVLAFSAHCSEESIIAVVNDQAITKSDLQKRIDFIVKSSGFDRNQANQAELKHHIMNILVDEILIEDDAKKNEIKLDDMDLKLAMNALAEKNGVTTQKFEQMLQQKGIDKTILEKQIKNQILMSKIIKTQIQPKIFVSDQEVKESRAALISAIAAAKEEKTITQIKIAEIVLYPEDVNAVKGAMNLAKDIVKQARAGKSFSNLATEFSQSSTSENGGVIGWVYINQIIPELAHLVVGKPANYISEPILLDDGIHILKLLDTKYRKTGTAPINEVDDETLKQMLTNRKLELQIKNYLRKLRKYSFISFN